MLHATSCAARSRTRSSAASTSKRHAGIPGVVAVYTGADMEALTHPFMGLLPLPGLYHPLFFALASRPGARRRRSGRARSSPSRATSPRTPRQLVEVDYEELRADRDHRARARSVPAGDLARAGGQRAAARPTATTATSTPRSRTPTGWCAERSCSTATPTSRWRRAGASPRSTRWRARCSTTRPPRTPIS